MSDPLDFPCPTCKMAPGVVCRNVVPTRFEPADGRKSTLGVHPSRVRRAKRQMSIMAKKRPPNYNTLSAEEQWAIDKSLGNSRLGREGMTRKQLEKLVIPGTAILCDCGQNTYSECIPGTILDTTDDGKLTLTHLCTSCGRFQCVLPKVN